MVADQRANPVYTVLPEIARRYGDVASLPMPLPGSTVTLLSHPEYVDHIMTRHHLRYVKHEAAHQLVVGEPPALPLLEGDEWKRTRRPLNPHFGEQALAGVSPQMAAAVRERVEAWARHIGAADWVNLEHELGAVVMDGLMRSMFTMTLEPDTLDKYVDAARDYGTYVVSLAAMYLFPSALPRPFRKRGEAAKRYLLSELDSFIVERRSQGPQTEPDVLDVLLGMSFDGNPRYQYGRLRSELSGLVFAGFETTAEALAWTLALLFRNPSVLAKAYAAVDALGGASVEYAHLEQLTYLRACFDEAQRIQAAPANVRTATEDDEIGGYFIPKGSHVVISPYGLHRDARFWTKPELFEPERFLTDKINRNAFIPFNIGPRKCMGSRMAYIEGVIALAAILQRYTFEIRPGWEPKHQMRTSTGLVGGLPVRIHRR
ncbi:cytochrome P450 [Mycolicibacter kumamotonensis]|uniref:Cytochrome P450 n=1 Tax=Mycolicibacter kumamotonensis TaxID=354243 RepID=A0A1B8SI73_9MYCO|nr:cytochrome P450 [Mycolicibacter kumamotonensis]